MAGEAQIRQGTRQAWGLIIYRLLLNFVFLVVALKAFPNHKTFVVLAVLSTWASITAIGESRRITALAENFVLDLAERKTRHTIVAAQNRGLAGQTSGDADFWGEVNDRVDAEVGMPDPPEPFWKACGLVLWNLAGHIFWDVLTVVLAVVVSTMI